MDDVRVDATPLIVDVDGTLLRTDLLIESFLALLATRPLRGLATIGRLPYGKAALKVDIADAAMPDMGTMPLNPAVTTLIADAVADGRPVYLASAADVRYVRALAERVGPIAGAFGTEAGVNLSGAAKARLLVERFGEGGFDYVGNHRVDLAVWRHCRRAYVIAGARGLVDRLRAFRPGAIALEHEATGPRAFLKALRPHQWLKNLLIFAPSAAAHTLLADLGITLAAFVAFSLCASSVYILNDLLDLAGDREHERKRRRPFASGAVPLIAGLAAIPVLLGIAGGIALMLPPMFAAALGIYYVMTLAYSTVLKRKPIVDVMLLACLYGIRVIAGGFATATTLSPWLEALAGFLFLSLALVKRNAELIDRIEQGRGDPVGRGYRLTDVPALEAMSAAAGYNAAMVLALYVNSPATQQLYAHPHRLYALCMLLVAWVSRVLLATRRGWMDDDPLIFAVKDRWSLVVAAAAGLVLLAATR